MPPTTSPSTLTLPEMQAAIARAGLTLNPGQMADLVMVWRQLAVLIDEIPREHPLTNPPQPSP